MPPRSERERPGARKTQSGQATIEAALTLPVVLIALLLVVQVGVVVRDALALVQAAREGARVAAVTASDDATNRAVQQAARPLDAERIVVSIEPAEPERERGTPVTVDLRYSERLRIPVVNRFVSLDLPLHASATMRLERPDETPAPEPTAAPTPTPIPP